MFAPDALCTAWFFLAVASQGAEAARLKAILPAEGTDMSARADALAEDRAVWVAQANATESELGSFEKVLNHDVQQRSRGFSGFQLAARNSGGPVNSPTRNAADLAPMAAMLDGLYEDSKKRIVELNEREQKSKKLFTARQAAHEARLGAIGAEFHKHSVSAALQATDSALEAHLEDEENDFMKYWGRVRERHHKQFHTFLKIQHGLMQRLKSMSDVYKQAEAGKSPQQVPPEVAFLQGLRAQRAEGLAFEQASLAEVVAARVELARWD